MLVMLGANPKPLLIGILLIVICIIALLLYLKFNLKAKDNKEELEIIKEDEEKTGGNNESK